MNRRGIWGIDRTHGFTLGDKDTIQSDIIIMPKLFRRLVSFFLNRVDYDDFMNFMKDNPDPVKKVSDGTITNLHELIVNEGWFYKLEVRPEMLIFIPK